MQQVSRRFPFSWRERFACSLPMAHGFLPRIPYTPTFRISRAWIGSVCTRVALLFILAGIAPAAWSQDFSQSSGAELFQRFCASCHGKTAEGDGVVGPVLQIRAPDLTEIAKRHGGQFPDNKTYQIIDGRVPITAHGTRDMPVWGIELWRAQGYDIEAGRKTMLVIDKLVDYLKSIQKPKRMPDPAGSAQPPESGKNQT